MNKLEKDYNMFDWWKKVFLKNYANFEGRARRAEYWYFNLVNMFFLIPFYILLIVAVIREDTFMTGVTGIIFILVAVVITIPSIAVSVRRLHDTNKSGWMYLLAIVPVASLVVFIFTVLEGDKHANRYGNDPKNPNADNELSQIGLE